MVDMLYDSIITSETLLFVRFNHLYGLHQHRLELGWLAHHWHLLLLQLGLAGYWSQRLYVLLWKGYFFDWVGLFDRFRYLHCADVHYFETKDWSIALQNRFFSFVPSRVDHFVDLFILIFFIFLVFLGDSLPQIKIILIAKQQINLLIVSFRQSIIHSVLYNSLLKLSFEPLDEFPVILILSFNQFLRLSKKIRTLNCFLIPIFWKAVWSILKLWRKSTSR